MRDDFSMDQVVGLECVYRSTTEHYRLDCFIEQYVKTRDLNSVPGIDGTLRSTLARYPGRHPVMVNELNAWIDRTLGYRAAHPDVVHLEDV
ncbi:hypothetical protein [Pseudomonas fluorescens]|jgi:hypothetical protein|uniref:hypothetical protein n=1 Tax=Pseudomonas fluorescens TaxID=294 RepID=UPI001911977C|nr:hypothetical protein [Pseudomonas fluorescens]